MMQFWTNGLPDESPSIIVNNYYVRLDGRKFAIRIDFKIILEEFWLRYVLLRSAIMYSRSVQIDCHIFFLSFFFFL